MKFYRNVLFILMVILISIGVLMIYSASNIWAEYKYNDAFKYCRMQFIFALIGLFLVFIISKIPCSFLEKYANKILLVCFILLVLVLIPGIGIVRNGSRSWFGIGSLGIQPSEAAKLGLIIYSSKYLAHNNSVIRDIKKGLGPLFLIIILFFFLIMLEPDFGTGMVILLTLVVLIYVSGPKLTFFLKLGILGLVAMAGLIMIAPYRMKRIVAYLNPWSDPLGSGFQIIQSLYAIGPSSLLGLGFGNSIQKNFYLPEPQTDFIFSIFAEEFGFLGVLVVFFLFCLLFYFSMVIAIRQNDLFKKYLVFGLAFGIILQVLLNILVISGTIPTTGITLPFFSYGGSSLLISMISIGIILRIAKEN